MTRPGERSRVMQPIVVAAGPVCEQSRVPPATIDHRELLARAEGGDRAAWEQLVARHDRRVLVSLLARGVPVDRARDLIQETWARLWEQQRAGRLERIDLPGLAIRQAGFLAMDDARRRARGPHDALPDDLADPDAMPEDRIASREQVGRALAALERMSPRAREVFTDVYDNPGEPHAVAAERLGLSVQRLRQTLCEVRARMRAAMETNDE